MCTQNGDNDRAPVDGLAISATDNALKAIERDLHTYGGHGRFTTWAAKFALTRRAFELRTRAR